MLNPRAHPAVTHGPERPACVVTVGIFAHHILHLKMSQQIIIALLEYFFFPALLRQ